MKSDECIRKNICDVGFIDPVRVNEKNASGQPPGNGAQLAKVHGEGTIQSEDIVSVPHVL